MVRYIEDDEYEDRTVKEALPVTYLSLIVDGVISQTFPLRGEVQLGRDRSNAVVTSDQKVSRRHAVLTPIDDTYIISDQGSANGTYVNGVLIAQPTRLKHNDRITFGDTTFLFTTSQPEVGPVRQPRLRQSTSPDLSSPVTSNNQPIWLVIGCMALTIIVLLIVVAMLLGIFVGRNQVTGVTLLWYLTGII